MKAQYSIYQAKTKLSEIIRQVKKHHRVTITDRGHPVAQVVPFEEPKSLPGRIAALTAAGAITPAKVGSSRHALKTVARRPGALKRFLDERD